ncbi:MAG: endolytic transglycosylase MltG [Candidatus Rokubacteria bacterium]|nr:endolytic transglycosylase MltG [Candidatus Rokubacteria bacterium]MBI3825296.1 endolytic transglycosylase MltG [Candidatus Rokubacteria bacterium]
MRVRPWLALVLVVAGAGAVEAWRLVTPASPRREPLTVEIPANQGAIAIAGHLAGAGVVTSAPEFLLLSAVRGSVRRLHAGEYEIAPQATTVDVLALVESGRVKQHVVLHPEGATLAELARVLEASGLARAADVIAAGRDPLFLRAAGVDAPSVEGYLFPDTYLFVRGMSPPQMLGRMVHRLETRLGPEIMARARQRGLSLRQLLTLASIVEREAVGRDERRLIAAVFWNRLERGMPLQADPTVQYAVGRERRTLTRVDLEADSPYNTYRYSGLPPGPIASPGLDAIEATLDPAAVGYLYFVAVDDHRHHFSTTLEEHRRAVARYRASRPR